MLTLAIDTATSFCSACLFDGEANAVGAQIERDIGRGHAEELAGVIETVMREAGAGFTEVGRIAVAIGPGSFSGIRVGVATARGFGVALSVPVVGVTTLEALAADARSIKPGVPVMVAVKGGRGQFFMQPFGADGIPASEPFAVAEESAADRTPSDTGLLVGNAASELAAQLAEAGHTVPTEMDRPTGAIATVARLAANAVHLPAPLYLRDADAKPQSGFALPRRETPEAEAAK